MGNGDRRPCRFVYFDAGFTLLHPYPSVGFHYAAVARKYGVDVEPAQIDAAFGAAWYRVRKETGEGAGPTLKREGAPAYGSSREGAMGFWSKVIRACFSDGAPEQPEFYTELFDRFADAECWRLYDDVKPAFELLEARGIPFGVLSNWDFRLRPVLEGLGVSSKLSSIILSCDVGFEKPHPAIFASAAEAVPKDARDAIGLIGDEEEADGTAPVRAGWRQCLVVRGNKIPADGLCWKRDLLAAVQELVI